MQDSLSVNDDVVLFREALQGNEAIYPHRLEARFEHIFARIGEVWSRPDEAKTYFYDLLTTERESRQGFPPEVHSEIFALSNFYNECHPTVENKDAFWSGIAANW